MHSITKQKKRYINENWKNKKINSVKELNKNIKKYKY